ERGKSGRPHPADRVDILPGVEGAGSDEGSRDLAADAREAGQILLGSVIQREGKAQRRGDRRRQPTSRPTPGVGRRTVAHPAHLGGLAVERRHRGSKALTHRSGGERGEDQEPQRPDLPGTPLPSRLAPRSGAFRPLPHPVRPCSVRSSPKAVCSARTASSVYLACTTQETLISEVEIIWMLIPSLPSTSNIRAATPEWFRIPTPTMEILTI